MDGRDRDHVFLGLGLGLGLQEKSPKMDGIRKNKRLLFLDLSISGDCGAMDSISSLNNVGGGDGMDQKSKNSCNVRFSREEDMSSHDTEDIISRKKLRLNRDQTALLEDSFRQHSTLNTAQKTSIAEKLNLRPRQVEVWFQNRRARTKLKQTEIDCEFLKKKCERLSEENRRLKKQLYELRSTTINVEKSPPASSNLFVHRISKNATFSNMRGGDTTASASTIEEPKPNYHHQTTA